MSLTHILKPNQLTQEWITRYTDFITQHPQANIYHTLAWHKVIQETYSYSPRYLIHEEAGQIKGVLPLFAVHSLIGRRLISIPYSHWVPILSTDESTLQALLRTVEHFCQQNNYQSVTLRHGIELPFDTTWQSLQQHYQTSLSLTSSQDEIWSTLDSSARRAVRRAKRDQVKIELAQTDLAYNQFYQLMLETRRRQTVPVYSPEFFASIRRHLVPNGQAKLTMAYLNDEAVGGIIVLQFGQWAIYGYGASVDDKEKLRSRPMDLLMWQAIENSHQNQAKVFDFGTTPRFHDSLLRFKEKWGGTSDLLPYYYWSSSGKPPKAVNRQGRLAETVGQWLSKLPEKIYIKVSSLIMKQLG